MKVLVADDSGVMRKIILRGLHSIGVNDVVEANDGSDALQKFRKDDFDLVITDWNMPEMTGLELAIAIRKEALSVPIVMVTTEAHRESVVLAIQAGVTDYLTKPFDNEVLRSKLEKYLLHDPV